ncbi:ferritin-like domain-containing protein [Nocardioides sp.]|uniref:ferritin-like domain-containing protein n=1 Tax=Nocardioides sp. TaxID=35761 RepID=UPI002721D440|nr:ferritin-like domain-containing protein [Nocardioides sp.]MDO9455391.1 ferritin-like domain-containing protein [Nocardioides sp.]
MTYLDALQATLAGEHAAMFVVGYLGGQTSQSGSPDLYDALRDSYTTHRGRRDLLVDLVRGAGGDPVAAAASYDLPAVRPDDPASIAAAALAVEQACGATYGYLVASATGDQRGWAIDAVLDSALRELALGGGPRAFPGR